MNDSNLQASISMLLIGALLLGACVLWIYALVSAISNERLDSTMKLAWVIVIVFVSLLGSLLYLFLAPHRPSQAERQLDAWNRRRRRVRAKAGF